MKRLYRSRKNRMLAGVCGGIAEYFEIDPVIVRLVAVALFFVGGSAILAYIIGMIIIPYEPLQASSGPASSSAAPAANLAADPAAASVAAGTARPAGSETVPLFIGILLIVIGGLFLLHNLPFFNPFYHEIRYYVRHFFWPSVLIVFGVFLIARGWKK